MQHDGVVAVAPMREQARAHAVGPALNRLKVLSINVYAMGHVAYQLALERGFSSISDVAFRSVHLSEANRTDLLGRIAYRLLTLRLPGFGGGDGDWIRLRTEVASSLFLRRLLLQMLASDPPDVVHIHTQSIALLASDLVRRTPTVISLDCTSALLARLHAPPAARTYKPIIRLERECLSAAAHVVCWSETARRSVIEDYGVSPERSTVILPTVPHGLFGLRDTRRSTQRKLRLLFVGNDVKRKGGEDLLAVYRERLHESCELDIVSNGLESVPRVEGVRLHRGLGPFSPALLELYANADVFVMPTYEDAFGLVYLEAMAAGLPCIGSDVLAVPELVGDGVRGIVVRAGDRAQLVNAIERLQNDELRARLGRAAKTFAETLCDDAINCRRLTAIFREIAGGARSP